MDPYQILGVSYEATDSEIKKAYYTLARKYHPDNFASDPAQGELANRKMREINAAYDRIRHDRAAGIRGAEAYRRSGPTAKPASGGGETSRNTSEKSSSGTAGNRDFGKADGARYGSSARYRSGTGGASFTGQDARYRADGMPRDFAGYDGIRRAVNAENYDFAEAQLLQVPELLRNAEWHYLRSLTLLRRLYYHDAFREIGTACRLDRKNEEYRKTREEMRRRVKESFPGGDENSSAKKKKRACDNPCADCCFRALGLEDRKL